MRPSLPASKPFRLDFQAVLSAILTVGIAFSASEARAQDYTSVVVFGDSLSDTGNVTYLTASKYALPIPGPVTSDYTLGRFTDGTDTVPAAHNYNGVWIEQLAAMLPAKPLIKNSLSGGTDYAYGFATTQGGTSNFTFGPGGALSVTVNNVGRQIDDYLATSPRINSKTLFVVWAGANDLLGASSPQDVSQAAIRETANIQRLIDAGATQFLVPNLPPLGLVPRLNGSPATSVPATQASLVYNQTLALGELLLRFINHGKKVQLVPMDVYGLFTSVVAKPKKFELTNVQNSSQGNYLVNPDTFLFWDDLHPTTRGHNILAQTALKLLAARSTTAATETEDEVAIDMK